MDTNPPPYKEATDPTTVTLSKPLVSAFLLPVFLLVGLGIGYLIWGRAPQSGAAAAAATTASPTAGAQQQTTRYDVPEDDDYSLGPANAAIVMIEFSDYQCPFCTKFQSEVFPKLMKEYEGKIRFVYRDFPLGSIHPNAAPAAESANCAGEQGKYWEYHNLLFSDTPGLSDAVFKTYAEQLSLDLEKFNECVSSHRTLPEVQSDYDYAAQLGIRSTPTFFINGLALVGAQPYEVFKDLIDRELAGEIPPG